MNSRRDFITTVMLAATGFALAPLAACSQDRPVNTGPSAVAPAATSPI